MKSHRTRARVGAPLAAGLSAALALSALVAAPAAAAPIEGETTVTDAVFHWALSNESGNRAFAPGTYNFLSAGIAPKTSGADTLSESEWAATSGTVTIEKLQADGSYATATWAGLKTDPSGNPITSPTSGAYSGNRVAIAAGTGTLAADTDDADLSWDGDFTVAFYSGMTQFSVSDPHLVVEGGHGELTATLNGYGTSMEDTSVFLTLPAQEVTLATFDGIDVTATGFEATPDYEGVTVDLPDTASPQVRTGDHWGSFPQSFIDYQLLTGQSSYWYSSGLSTDAAKAALPVSISIGTGEPGSGEPGTGEPGTGEPGTGGPGTGEPQAGDTVVEGAQLEWSYSRYAQYGVFGAWSMKASGAAVSTGTANGKSVTGLDADASTTFNLVRFDGGEGSLDAETGAGTISWPDTGDWVLNAYNGQYGAPDETLRDPILTIGEDGSGDLSFEAYIPAGLDMNGEPAPAAGPTRIAIATFSSVTVENDVITVQPDYAGRPYSPTLGSPWAECTGAGGSWPSAWIDFLPSSVQAHYYSTSCSGLNLMKPPTAFTVALASTDAELSAQPADASVDAGQNATFAVAATGNPLSYQWQRSTDGTGWTDIEGATDSKLVIPTVTSDDGTQIRALINGSLASDAATLTVRSEAPTLLYSGEDTITYEGSFASLGAYASGIPEPGKQWQVSTDGGDTWQNRGDVVGASQSLDLVPTVADDGLLARAVFSNGVGDDVTSVPQKLTVVAYSGPSSMWVQGGPLTADDIANWNVAMRASFAGFVLPEGSTTDIQAALVPESALADTNTPSLDDAVWYETLYASNLGPSNGHQPNQRVEAWQQLDPAVRYYLVTYSTDLTDRSYDSRLLLPIEGQVPDATPIEHATVEFGFNDVHQGASPAGGCNYFVAGKVQGLGSDYTSIDGNVYVIKKHADGSSEVVSVGTRCTPAEGSTQIDQRYLFTEGTGQTAADGSTTIQWTGAGTTNAYGGLVSWYFENPKLVLDASGNGSITANVGGFGSSMDDPTVKVPLDPREGVEIATVRGAAIENGALTIDPVWKNVDYYPLTNPQDASSARSTTSAIPQAAKDANPNWGSWPESFVDFQYATGLSSYWHTSGLTADPLKPPLPIEVEFDGAAPDYGVLFTTEPVSAVLSEGDDVTFHAAASGQAGTPTLQWQVKRAGGEWTDLDGETRGELTLTAVSVADWNGASVRATATLGDRTATSVVATLKVTAPALPVFQAQPTDVETLVDQSAYFSVEVTGYPAPTFQWQRQAPGGEWENVAANGTYAWYNFYPATLADDGTAFRVIATNASGSTISDVAHMSVGTLPVTIESQPKNLTVFDGGSGWLAAWVEGAPYPTFQWERSLDGTTWEAVAGATDSVLDFGLITPEIAKYVYRLTATNGLASVVTDPASVTILPASDVPLFVTPSENLDPAVDTTLRFTLGQLPALPTGSTGTFRIGLVEKSVWQPGDDAIGYADFVPFAVGNYSAGDLSFYNGEIWVQAGSLDPSKEYGVAMMFESSGSTPALPQFDLYVPVTVAQPAAPSVTVSKVSGLDPNGETVTITGSGFLPNSPDTDAGRPPLAGKFGGVYVVFGKFAETWQPSANAPSSARSVLAQKWAVSADDVATIGGADAGAIEVKPDGTFETTLTVASGAFDKEGTYGIYTYGGGGVKYAPFETATPVTLNEAAPAVTTQPVSVVAPSTTGAAQFTVAVSGAPAPAVQWERLGASGWAAIDGATAATLSLPFTATDDGASVRAVVTNGLGSVTSDAATLVVTPSDALEPLTDADLTDGSRGPVTIVSVDGRTVTLSLGARSAEFEGRFVGAEVHSTPVFLGWQQVTASGTVAVTVPSDLAAGTHKLALRDASGALIGWAALVVPATPGEPVTPVDPGSGGSGSGGSGSGGSGGSGSDGSGGSGSGSAATTLSNTGFEAAGWVAGALLLLLTGTGVLLTRRLRRS